jgi:hypothetical protein
MSAPGDSITSGDARESVEDTMERNRQALRALLKPAVDAPGGPAKFPRSATFRWVLTRISARSILSAVASACIARVPGLRTLFRRRIF